jgi:predicted PurR-regulated permease PerM
MTLPRQVSYGIMLLTFVLVAWLGLATPFITVLFCYFALRRLSFHGNKGVAIVLLAVLVIAAGYGFGYFFHQAVQAFPKITEHAIPAIIQFAKQHNLELPFTNWETLRTLAMETIVEEVRYLGKRATLIGKQIVFIVIGVVVAISLFLNARLDLEGERRGRQNLYSLICREIEARFHLFYRSFARVMGAQISISTINTGLTSLFVTWISLPYAGLVIAVTFFCGLLPIIGNLISNTVIVSIAFTVSPKLGIAALVFLVVLHKLEYFLNSKIIGKRIHNPMWLTLLALVVAERVMGIPGIILAPVILDYLRTETSRVTLQPKAEKPAETGWRAAG